MPTEQFASLGKKSHGNMLAINFIYAFIVSALSVLIPLYLLQKNIDVTVIGLILAVMPLTFMVLRVLFAGIADTQGTGKIAIFYAITAVVAIIIYMTTSSPIGFVLAVLVEGLRTSAFWAVVRTEIINVNPGVNTGKTLARYSNFRQLADGAARLFIGLALTYLAFQSTFLFLLALSIVLLVLVLYGIKLDKSRELLPSKQIIQKVFTKRPITFWYSAFLQLFVWLAYNMLTGFLLPLYLASHLSLSYQSTALLIAIFSLVTAFTSIILIRFNLSKRSLIAMTIITVPAIILIPYVGTNVLPLLLLLAFGSGCSNIVAEYILIDQVYRSRNISTDTGMLYIPLRTAEFLFLSLGGLAITYFGYTPLFFVLGLSTMLFIILGLKTIKSS